MLGLAVTTPRAVIRPADPLLYLVPQDRPLVIAAQVPPIHIDQVHVGQAVELVFSSFSSRTTPHLAGKVSVVSADAFTDQATQARRTTGPRSCWTMARSPSWNGQPCCPACRSRPSSRPRRARPLAYLLKPFTDYFTRAFRES